MQIDKRPHSKSSSDYKIIQTYTGFVLVMASGICAVF